MHKELHNAKVIKLLCNFLITAEDTQAAVSHWTQFI